MSVEPPTFTALQFPSDIAATCNQMRITGMSTVIEKRSVPRHKVLKGATIAFDGNGLECTVRNLSSNGAAIDIANLIRLPPSFMLVIEADQFIRRCRPVWRNDKRVGVAFD
jgi:PilZ domain